MLDNSAGFQILPSPYIKRGRGWRSDGGELGGGGGN